MPLVSVQDIHKAFGSEQVLAGISHNFYDNRKVGLIGPNGCGKSTLLKIILSQLNPDLGSVKVKKNTTISYLPQEPQLNPEHTVMEEMHLAVAHITQMHERVRELAETMARAKGDQQQKAMREYENLTHKLHIGQGYDVEAKMRSTLAGLGIEQGMFEAKIGTLSGGQLSRVGLAKVLTQDADMLLLDEPTNHLDLAATAWLERFIRNSSRAFIIISHDRYLLDAVAEEIIELRNKKSKLYKGNYSSFVKQKETIALARQRQYEKRAEMVSKTRDFIARNKDQEGMRGTARGRKTRLEKMLKYNPDFLERPEGDGRKISFNFKKPSAGAELVLRCEYLEKSFGQLLLFKNMTFDVVKGERLVITGPNGTGKSTFLKMAMDRERPSGGKIKMAQNLKVGYLDQQAQTLDPKNDVLEEVKSARPDLTEQPLRNALGAFLFTGDDVFKKVSALSGGQQNRLMLAKLVLSEPDMLVLDEPTNHLDIDSREMLENALLEYPGTIIAVSHDRYFLDRIGQRMLVIGNDRTGEKSQGDHELVYSPAKPWSFYIETLEQRRFDRQQEADSKPSGGKKTAPPAKSEPVKKTPEHIRPFNKYKIEQIEDMVHEGEAEVEKIKARFAKPEVYENHEKVRRVQEQLDEANKKLELLYEVWEYRMG